MSGWFLESLVEGGKRLRVPIHPLPFLIGRRTGLDLTLPSESVSKEHAEIYERRGSLRVRDLHSTNGTFVERRRVKDVSLQEGNILHFAEFEFRIGRKERRREVGSEERGTLPLTSGVPVPYQLEGIRELEELIRERAVEPAFEPIVALPSGVVAGYEVLGRGRHPGLSEDPGELFRIASSVGVEADLSRLFRHKALELVGARTGLPPLFLNTHLAELEDGARFLKSIKEIRALAPQLDLTLEIHGSAFDNPRMIAELRACLYELHLGLAYEDFSTTPTRLVELVEGPPDYVKFDARLVRGIDRAPVAKRRLLTSLVATARDLAVRTVAAGVATAAEAEVCAAIGFTHAQGTFFGEPVGVDRLP